MYMLITREQKICSVFHLELKLFSNVSVKIWNALFSKFVWNVPLYKFKKLMKEYLLSHIIVINSPK